MTLARLHQQAPMPHLSAYILNPFSARSVTHDQSHYFSLGSLSPHIAMSISASWSAAFNTCLPEHIHELAQTRSSRTRRVTPSMLHSRR